MWTGRLARLACASLLAVAATTPADAGKRRSGAKKPPRAVTMTARECLARAMYFESARTEEDGMLAVGTIVANRLASGRYGASVCAVVGQKSQFAPGVLARSMREARVADKARRVADAVLRGERHPIAEDVMFFHTANVPFRHHDKHYVLVSGGNAFYRWNRDASPSGQRANVLSFARATANAETAEAVGDRIVEAALRPWLRTDPAAATQAAVAARIDPLPVALVALRREPPRTPPAAEIAARAAGARVIAIAPPVEASAIPSATPAAKPMAVASRAAAAVSRAWSLYRL